MTNPVASPTNLPRAGRVLQSDIKRVRYAVMDAVLERDKQRLEAAVKPVREAMIRAYDDHIPQRDIETCRRYHLLDSVDRDMARLWSAERDTWYDITIQFPEPLLLPKNYRLGFYTGGLSEEVLAKPHIVDFSVQQDNLELIHALATETIRRTQEAATFCAGHHDGNKTVRPLWSEVYECFPELKRRRAL